MASNEAPEPCPGEGSLRVSRAACSADAGRAVGRGIRAAACEILPDVVYPRRSAPAIR